MSLFSSQSPRHGRAALPEGLFALAAGAVIVVVGALVADGNGWSTGALWAVGLAGALVASLGYAVPALRRAPSLRDQSASDTMVRSASNDADPNATEASDANVALGMSIGPLLEDADGLAPKRVIVLSGARASGKTRIAERLHSEHPDWGWASCGAFVKAEALQRGGDTSRPATNDLGQKLVDDLGGEKFLSAVLAHSKVPPSAATLIIDDVYHAEVFDAVKRRWGHLKFVTVTPTDSMRRQLSRERDLPDAGVQEPEANPLDAAVSNLAAQHQPELILEGAETEDAITARTREIDELVAA
jgi:hypothetical protein